MIIPDYGLLVELRKNLKKRYANGIMSRAEYEKQEREISDQIAAAERGRRTGKVV